MKRKQLFSVALITFFAGISFGIHFARAVELVRDRKATAVIVIPADPFPAETYAAKELQYHVQRSSGVELPIISEDKPIPAGAHVYLGHCKASAIAGVDPSSLPGNSYLLKTIGDDLFICGKDSKGDPLDRDTHEGTLFGVYDILETNLGVRWLWPGKLGEVIPTHAAISLPALNATVKPLLWFWPNGGDESDFPAKKIWLQAVSVLAEAF